MGQSTESLYFKGFQRFNNRLRVPYGSPAKKDRQNADPFLLFGDTARIDLNSSARERRFIADAMERLVCMVTYTAFLCKWRAVF